MKAANMAATATAPTAETPKLAAAPSGRGEGAGVLLPAGGALVVVMVLMVLELGLSPVAVAGPSQCLLFVSCALAIKDGLERTSGHRGARSRQSRWAKGRERQSHARGRGRAQQRWSEEEQQLSSPREHRSHEGHRSAYRICQQNKAGYVCG